jgi:hypothetical protein
MVSIFGEDSDTNSENRSVRESSANLNTTPKANNLPPTASLENNEKESPTSNSSRLDADALSIGRQLYIVFYFDYYSNFFLRISRLRYCSEI